MTDVLQFPPVRDGYSFVKGYGYITTKLEGGAMRVRKDLLEPAHSVSLNWVLRETEYTEFMGFFETILEQGSLPFLAELLGDLSIPNTYKCRCSDGVPRLTANKGNAYYLTANVEVEDNATVSRQMTFSAGLPGFPPRVNASPKVLSQYQIADVVRIHRAFSTFSPGGNYDGVYTVTGLPNANSIEFASGAGVNPMWNIIDAGPGSELIYGTITRVPT